MKENAKGDHQCQESEKIAEAEERKRLDHR
jgi:hypothetical protein